MQVQHYLFSYKNMLSRADWGEASLILSKKEKNNTRFDLIGLAWDRQHFLTVGYSETLLTSKTH